MLLERLAILAMHVTTNSDVNKMDLRALTVIFVPMLKAPSWVIAHMINEFDEVFLNNDKMQEATAENTTATTTATANTAAATTTATVTTVTEDTTE